MDQKEITREITKYLRGEWNEKISYQNLIDTIKEVLGGTFMAGNAYIKKVRSQITYFYTLKSEKCKSKLNSTVAEGRE